MNDLSKLSTPFYKNVVGLSKTKNKQKYLQNMIQKRKQQVHGKMLLIAERRFHFL